MRLLRFVNKNARLFFFIAAIGASLFGAQSAHAATLLSNINETNDKGTSIFRSNIWVAYKFTAGASATVSSVTIDLDHTVGNYSSSVYTGGVIRFYNDNSGNVGSAISGTLTYTSTNTGNGVTVYGTASGGTITIPSAGTYWIALTCGGCANIDYQESSSTSYTGSTGWATIISSAGISTSNNNGSSWGTPYSSITYGAPMMTIAGNLADSTAPTITSVSSDKANGSYGVGERIDIDVTFSEAVTSTGNVTVTLETGTTDRTCTFTVTSATTGSCNYTVQSGDSSSDLTVSSISGTIADAASNAMSNFTPSTNLADSKALVVDAVAPTISETTAVATPTSIATPSYVFTSDESGTITYGGSCSSATTSAAVGANTITFTALADGVYSDCTIMVTDSVGNQSSVLAITSFTIAPSAPESGGGGGGGKGGEPEGLADPVSTATMPGQEPQKNTQKIIVDSGEKFSLNIKAPDADMVKSVTVKVGGKIYPFTLQASEQNPTFISRLSFLNPGTYKYTVVVDYGSTVKRSAGTIIVKKKDSVPSAVVDSPKVDNAVPVSTARIISSPRVSTPAPSQRVQAVTDVSPAQASETVPVVSSAATPLPQEDRVLQIQISAFFDQAAAVQRSFFASVKSVIGSIAGAPRKLYTAIANLLPQQTFRNVTIKLASAEGVPLSGAVVTIHSKVQTAVADKDGVVTFRDIPKGNHELHIAYQEYKSRRDIALNHDAQEVTINIVAEFKK